MTADDGAVYGEYAKDLLHMLQIDVPGLGSREFNVDWKSLPTNLVYVIPVLPRKIEITGDNVSPAFNKAATQPRYDEGFE